MKTTTINSGGFHFVNYFSKASLIPKPIKTIPVNP